MPHEDKNNGDDKQEKLIRWPKYKKYLMLQDENTGEIVGHFPLKHKGLGTGWIALYQTAIQQIAIAHLPDEQNRVFMYMLGTVDFDNYWRISQKQISEALNMKQPAVARAIKALCERDIIVEGPRAGLNKTYRLNPNIAHKGKDKDQTAIDFSGEKRRRRPKFKTEDE